MSIESIIKDLSVMDPSMISLSRGVVVIPGRSVHVGLRVFGRNGFSLGLTKRLRGRKELRLAGLLLGSTLSRATQNVRSWTDAGTLNQEQITLSHKNEPNLYQTKGKSIFFCGDTCICLHFISSYDNFI